MFANRSYEPKLGPLARLISPGVLFAAIIFGALIAFEMFNYSTTDHALQDILGTLEFGPIHWSTLLAIAFCGIDFAGIARLFTPQQGLDEPKEIWYLFGAWIVAATINAILTWWGVSMAIVSHPIQSAALIDPKTILSVVPVFVAVMVWIVRILLIGTLSIALDRALHVPERPALRAPEYSRPKIPVASSTGRSEYQPSAGLHARAEPSYHSLSARPNAGGSTPRRA